MITPTHYSEVIPTNNSRQRGKEAQENTPRMELCNPVNTPSGTTPRLPIAHPPKVREDGQGEHETYLGWWAGDKWSLCADRND